MGMESPKMLQLVKTKLRTEDVGGRVKGLKEEQEISFW